MCSTHCRMPRAFDLWSLTYVWVKYSRAVECAAHHAPTRPPFQLPSPPKATHKQPCQFLVHMHCFAQSRQRGTAQRVGWGKTEKSAAQSHLHCLVSTSAVPITLCGREVCIGSAALCDMRCACPRNAARCFNPQSSTPVWQQPLRRSAAGVRLIAFTHMLRK